MSNNAKTITLELLRDGPPHNQLISPLTAYLAACQNRPPEVVRFKIEHRDFLRWQAGLTYARAGRPTIKAAEPDRSIEVERRHAIDDASVAVTDALGAIRALIGELASDPCTWRHIHLIVDASEVAALPFELAKAPPGVMVEGDRLFLQQNARVTLTRQTRRVATSVVNWPSRPRILCIIADGELPADAHVLALRQHIDAWIGWDDAPRDPQNDDEDGYAPDELKHRRKAEAEQILTVLENPTLDEVSEAGRGTCFTHVHVLAHGTPLPGAMPGQTLYGLLFRGPNGGRDVVDGDRLEAALRHPRGACAHPTVVTLMTCEGGSMTGGVLGPGGSAAHALHAKGIPLVVSSQFPLTKKASVIATDLLYKALLRGDDPRETVHAIRRELLVARADTHDWASLVLYGSFPPDLHDQLGVVRRAHDRIAAETSIERLRVSLIQAQHETARGDGPHWEERHAREADRVDRDVARVRALTDGQNPADIRVRAYRMLARFALRLWDVYELRKNERPTEGRGRAVSGLLERPSKHDFATGQRPITALQPVELLKLAKDAYEKAFMLDGSRWELWIQVVVLHWVWSPEWGPKQWRDFVRDVTIARSVLQLQRERTSKLLDGSGERELAAALSFEIELLAFVAMQPPLPMVEPGDNLWFRSDQELRDLFDEFLREVSPASESYRAHCALRQLRRYQRWLEWGAQPFSSSRSTPRARVESAAGLVKEFIKQLRGQKVRSNWGLRG